MDVKDLNSNAVSIQAMFTKAVVGQVSGAGFANFLQSSEDGLASVVGKKDEFAVVKNEPTKKEQSDNNPVETKPVENKIVETEDKAVVKKDKVSKKENKDISDEKMPVKSDNKHKKTDEENVAITAVNSEKVEISNVQKVSNEEGEVLNADNVVDAFEVVVSQDVAPLTLDVLPEAMVSLQADAVAVFIEKNDAVIMAEGLNLTELAKMPEVPVFDEKTGQIVKLSGSDVVQKVQLAEQNDILFVEKEMVGEKLLTVVPAKIEEVVEREFNFGEIDNVAVNNDAQTLINQEVVEQARILDTKLGEDKKLKVSVNLNEENFSYADETNLIQDKVLLEEAIKSVVKENSLESKPAQFGVQTTNQMQLSQAIPQQVGDNVAVGAVGTVSVAVQNGAEAVKAGGVEAVSSVANNSGQVLGGAVVANAEHKSDSVSRAFETSSKDVYKGLSKEVIEQVKVNITKSAVKGVDKIDIQLKPQELGNIEVKMQISKDGKLQAHIISGKMETMEILQREIQDLEKAFNDAGFETDSGSFSFSFRGDESGNEKDRSAELRSFIGNVLEQDSEEVRAENDNLQDWNPTRGLNIRV